ncbi:hypothetical protein KOR42_29890 [Thalassoglobus neptunius]|uniref:Uncharacterized protein n=1 Tax=Thalassoglobus neptunius TaxID=1938619 RepID=A0A5C5WQI2_9PLAN|nr:hypothetical protein KOR42_29890 [Thalassoglobus neptunius]
MFSVIRSLFTHLLLHRSGKFEELNAKFLRQNRPPGGNLLTDKRKLHFSGTLIEQIGTGFDRVPHENWAKFLWEVVYPRSVPSNA